MTITDMGGFPSTGFPIVPSVRPGGVSQLFSQDPAVPSVSFGMLLGGSSGLGFISAHTPDGGIAGGVMRSPGSVDLQTHRTAATQVTYQGGYGTISGGASNTTAGLYGAIGGGGGNYVNNYCTIAGGQSNFAGAAGDHATVCGGRGNSATNHRAFVGGGDGNSADGSNSWIPGGQYAKTRDLYGVYAWSGGRRAANGDCQQIGMPVRATTTDATTTTLTSGGLAVSASTIMVLPNNSSLSGFVVVTARDTSGNCATWWIAYRVTRGANAASTAVAYQTALASHLDAALSAATAVIAADTTQGALVISVAGVAATTIDWAADPFGPQIVR